MNTLFHNTYKIIPEDAQLYITICKRSEISHLPYS